MEKKAEFPPGTSSHPVIATWQAKTITVNNVFVQKNWLARGGIAE
jgi:hypothetical protein